MSEGDKPGASDAGAKSKQNTQGARHKSTENSMRKRLRFAALDLGTNNCRLLIAAPQGKKLRIVDAFSRIVRLGEGLSSNGVLSDAAMKRTIDALKVCAQKIEQRQATHIRCIATQACRSAANRDIFMERIREETGLAFDIITTEEEARLAVAGCAELIDPEAHAALIFDIGGGSTELSWMRRNHDGAFELAAWTSMPLGVVSLAEKHDGRNLTEEAYQRAVADVRATLSAFGDPAGLSDFFHEDGAHFLGTSGTVTSIAGVHLELPRYRRNKVDGLWLTIAEAAAVTDKLKAMSLKERADEPCIGPERADLVLCGCAILDALAQEWPTTRIRVADRGLREGVLADLAAQAKREDRQRRRRRKKGKKPSSEGIEE